MVEIYKEGLKYNVGGYYYFSFSGAGQHRCSFAGSTNHCHNLIQLLFSIKRHHGKDGQQTGLGRVGRQSAFLRAANKNLLTLCSLSIREQHILEEIKGRKAIMRKEF